MKAARYYGNKDIRIEEVPEPIPGDNEVLVEVEYCGICGSDLTEYYSGPLAIPRPERPHPLTGAIPPITMGHEFCGRIKRVPEGSKLSCGQPVMVDPRLYCGSCHICTETRDTNGCPKYGFLGLSGGGGGGLSSVVAVQESMCHPLPDEASLETAAICEPMAVGWHAVRSTEIKDFANKSCLILGGGPIGIAVIYSLKANGAKAKDIIVSEPTKERREHNLKLTENVIDPITGKILDKCMELTGGKGVDVVFDCAGVASGLFDGVMALRHKGVYMNIAGWGTPFAVPFGPAMVKEVAFKFSLAYNDDDFREAVEAFCDGKFPGVESMITSRIALEDVVEKGFKELIGNKDHHVKILVSLKKQS